MGINETIADTRHWITEHKLKAIGQSLTACFQLRGTILTFLKLTTCSVTGGLWGTGVLGSLAFQWSRPIPTQLKIIHSRVYAQVMSAISHAACAQN